MIAQKKNRSIFIFLVTAFLIQGCMQVKSEESATPTVQNTATSTQTKIPQTQIAQTSPTATRTKTPEPQATIRATKGNLFIRRGPDMAYNPVGVLYKDITANIIARDVLTRWVQIVVPDSAQTGWVSVQTQFSKIEGDLSALPEFKITDWPVAGYVRNCTNHGIVLEPGEIYIDSVLRDPENLVWVYPGHYKVYDVDTPEVVELESIETREGLTIDVHEDGAGDYRKCP